MDGERRAEQPSAVRSPQPGLAARHSAPLGYDDISPLSFTRTDKIDATKNLVSVTLLDSLGRVQQNQLTSDPQGTFFVDTTYDGLGRVRTVSNPYRAGDTVYVTTTNYDALSRVTSVVATDGAVTSALYEANCTTVTDPVLKKRKSCSDALGRMTSVWEPDSAGSFIYETAYQYDTLDNLTRVDQKGNDPNPANWRTRTFAYDSLSRLTSAANPESGSIGYTYDDDGPGGPPFLPQVAFEGAPSFCALFWRKEWVV